MAKGNFSKVLGLLTGTLAVAAVAQPQVDPYFDVQDEPVVEEVLESEIPAEVIQQMASEGISLPLPGKSGLPSFPSVLGDGSSINTVLINEIINLGERIWKLVEKAQPVVNVKFASANALPKGVEGWAALSDWQAPSSRKFQVAYKNGFGSNVVTFTYRLITTTGGNFKGVGKYIAQMSTIPSDISTSWGYTFDAENSIPSVVNVGSDAAPVAGAEIHVAWDVKTVVKHVKKINSYFVRGDGQFANLSE